jgi:acyl carrier protein
METQLNIVVARVMNIPIETVQSDTGPRTLGAWTSLRHVQLIAAVEDSYGIRFSPKEIRSIRSVAILRNLVRAKTETDEVEEAN